MYSRFLPIIAISSAVVGHAAAQSGKCTDIPLTFTVHPIATLMNLDGTVATDSSGNPMTAPSAIIGDGNDVYTGSIQFCSGTYDAVLNVINSKRKFTAILPSAIPNSGTNSMTPPPGQYTVNGVLNVRNIICSGCVNPGQPFVTRAGVQLDSMFNGAQYGIRFLPVVNITTLPFAPDLDNDATHVSNANSPQPSSFAIVLPQSYNCSTGVYPSWIVRGTLQDSLGQPSYLQVGTLVDAGKTGSGNTPVGQFSMPFEYQIQANSCFHPY